MRENLAKLSALGLAALITFAATRGVELGVAGVVLSALAAGSLYVAFGNALMLLIMKRALVPFYHGTEFDSREEFSKRPYGPFGIVASPLTFGLFLLLCLHG
jgi:hypothetical protein